MTTGKKSKNVTKPRAKGKDRILQQIRLSDEVQFKIKLMAAEQDCYLMEVHDKIIDEFLNSRKKILKETDSSRLSLENYLPASPEGKYRSLWVQKKTLEDIKLAASEDKVTPARILHTAINNATKN